MNIQLEPLELPKGVRITWHVVAFMAAFPFALLLWMTIGGIDEFIARAGSSTETTWSSPLGPIFNYHPGLGLVAFLAGGYSLAFTICSCFVPMAKNRAVRWTIILTAIFFWLIKIPVPSELAYTSIVWFDD